MDLTTILLIKIGLGLTTMGLAYLAIRALEAAIAFCRKFFELRKVW